MEPVRKFTWGADFRSSMSIYAADLVQIFPNDFNGKVKIHNKKIFLQIQLRKNIDYFSFLIYSILTKNQWQFCMIWCGFSAADNP